MASGFMGLGFSVFGFWKNRRHGRERGEGFGFVLLTDKGWGFYFGDLPLCVIYCVMFILVLV